MTGSLTGLRARKRQDTMRRIQEVALDLFDRHGFHAVAIEQVAAQSDVSAMTVYRYFSTKENLVLHDDLHPELVGVLDDLLGTEPDLHTAIDTLLQSVPDLEVSLLEQHARQRIRWVTEVPSISGLAHIQAREVATRLVDILVSRHQVDDLQARVAVHAVLGALEAACDHWYRAPTGGSLKEVCLAAVAALRQIPGEPS